MYSKAQDDIISTNIMPKAKVTLICTVLNEAKSIGKLIDSIAGQLLLPSEIIIVDGGSKDSTLDILNKKKNEFFKLFNLKVIIKKGNRSIGRNEAIKQSSNEIILSTDSGCELDKNWIKNILEPFKDKSVDVVAGYYKGKEENIFQKCLVPYVLVMEDKINPKEFLPATRSMAFKKSVWKKIGGFDQKLSHNEDYAFANRLKNKKIKIIFARNAIVYWFPRKDILQAFKMFFRFSLGDIQAKILRTKVVYLILRYVFALYLVILSLIMKSMILDVFVLLCFVSYVLWAILKNYKYVNKRQALVYLPVLQFISDFAVLSGTFCGYILGINIKNIFKNILNFKGVLFVIIFYALLLLSVINWGIPGVDHPFNYFMDEWHQSQSVRDLFKLGTPNVPGAANGSIFQFFLSGLYLIPFYIFHILDPFAIKSSVTNLHVQSILFQVLRLNTLFFGIGSVVLISYISKKYFKLNTFFVSFLFAFNPLFIMLSNYFKYDIALVFWIIVSLFFLLRYAEKPNTLNFVLGGFFIGLSLSTKLLTPLPLVAVYVVSFFVFAVSYKNNLKLLFIGLLTCFLTYILYGNPDIILGKGSLNGYIYSNIVLAPLITANYNLDSNWWSYLVFKLYPILFGRTLYSLFILGIISGFIVLIKICFNLVNNSKKYLTNAFNNNKFTIVLALFGIFFYASLVPIKIQATNNRVLVLLPFIALTAGLLINKLYAIFQKKGIKMLFIFLIGILLFFQLLETISWFSIKWSVDPRKSSSSWILNNIPAKNTIGIENIPIYQMEPDFVLKEFYAKQYNNATITRYSYKVITPLDKTYPKYIIVTNDDIEYKYLKKSPKIDLLVRLNYLGYKRIVAFTPNFKYLKLFSGEFEYYLSNLIQSPNSISIYEK